MEETKNPMPSTVLDEIITAAESWGEPWIQDALRRVVEKGLVSEEDVAALVRLRIDEACSPEFSHENAYKSLVSSSAHGPASAQASTSLIGIKHIKGVNRLAEGQGIPLEGEGIHIIFGNNGSGKSGYARILKSACRFRGRKPLIEGDIAVPAPPRGEAEIRYQVGQEKKALAWNSVDSHDHDELRRVLIFDSDVAESYIADDESPSFVPFGLGIPDMLVKLVDTVRGRIAEEVKSLAAKNVEDIAALRVKPGTKAAKLLESEVIPPRELEGLVAISAEEERRFQDTRTLLEGDRPGLIKKYGENDARLKEFRTTMARTIGLCSPAEQVKNAAALAERKAAETRANEARAKLQDSSLFPGIGGDEWRKLWEAAKGYSARHAYPEKGFPNLDKGAACVFCQSELDAEAASRLALFAESLTKQDELDLARAESKIAELVEVYCRLPKLTERFAIVDQTIAELVGSERAEELHRGIAVADDSTSKIIQALKSRNESGLALDQTSPGMSLVDEAIVRNEARLRQAKSVDDPAEEQKQRAFADEIESRRKLADSRDIIDCIIARQDRIRRLRPMLDGSSRQITNLAGELSEKYVTAKYLADFRSEIDALRIGVAHPVPSIKTIKAVTKLGISLEDSNRKIVVKNIASEGEQRAIALACFLAELGQSDSRSTLVFDDPISSLDHINREKVARRLVHEAKSRQVVIFTHDETFSAYLLDEVEKQEVACTRGMLEWQSARTGHYIPKFPWSMLKTGERIDLLEKGISDIRGKRQPQATGEDTARIRQWYSDYRATVERLIEEKLLGNVINRGRRYINLQWLNACADIPVGEIEEIQRLFGLACDLCSAHDPQSAANPDLPTCEEMARNLAELKGLLERIAARHKAAKK